MSATIERGRLNREIWGVIIALTGLLIAISLISFSANDRSFNTPSGAIDTHNWGGFVGAFLADLLLQGLGLSSYLLPIFLGIAAAQLFRATHTGIGLSRTVGYAILLVSVGVILSVLIDSESARDAGGMDKGISIDVGQRVHQCSVVEQVDGAMREARFRSCWITATETGYAPTVAEQASDDGLSDAGACAGDDRYLAVELSHRVVLSRCTAGRRA